MGTHWVLVEEIVGGFTTLRKLAATDNKVLAEEIFKAVVDTGNYDRVHLVEVCKSYPKNTR